jgi:AGCS family alanine or glycine:cation symporter
MAKILDGLEQALAAFATFTWNYPVVGLFIGGGLFFMIYCRLLPFRYPLHAVRILCGHYDRPDDPGQVSHFRALSAALAATVGMGNITGVAVAITGGGPGAIFWMWLSAILGMATKFFTCTLAVLYRRPDRHGVPQGGPMYYLVEGLGPRFRPLAVLFSIAGLFGCLALLQSNQLAQLLNDEVFVGLGWFQADWQGRTLVGVLCSTLVALVIFGGLPRIALVASRLVPTMVLIYLGTTLLILAGNLAELPAVFAAIVEDAFSGRAVAGGALGSVIITGVRRAAFSNEAGVGTEAMAHGAARTREPVREGLVAMLGPFIDTLVVATSTATVILLAGTWQEGDASGITLTTRAFETHLPGFGRQVLILCAAAFSISTMLGYSFYGGQCAAYLWGSKARQPYNLFYVVTLAVAAVVPLGSLLDLLDGMFALMAIPTMTGALLLAPKVIAQARDYFERLERAGQEESGSQEPRK